LTIREHLIRDCTQLDARHDYHRIPENATVGLIRFKKRQWCEQASEIINQGCF